MLTEQDLIDKLKRCHTKQLLKYKYSPPDWLYAYDVWTNPITYNFQEIVKDILATRPHIPSKQEGRKARQLKAKQGRTKGRKDR